MNINQKIEERRAILRKERENSQILEGEVIEQDERKDLDVSTKSQGDEKDHVFYVQDRGLAEGEKISNPEDIQEQRNVKLGESVDSGVIGEADRKTQKWDAVVIIIIGVICLRVISLLGLVIIFFGGYSLFRSVDKRSGSKVGLSSGWFSAGRALIGIGISIIIYTRAMPVSLVGSDVVNLHLLSERQSLLMIGMGVFLAGAVWETVRMLSPKPKEPLAKDSSSASSAAGKSLQAWLDKKIIVVSGVIDVLSTKMHDLVYKKEKKGLQRLVIGIFVAGLVNILVESIYIGVFYFGLEFWRSDGPTLDAIVDRVVAGMTIISFFYLFRDKQPLILLREILLVIVVVIILTRVLSAIFFGNYGIWINMDVSLVISLLAILVVRYLLNKKVRHSSMD